MKLRTSEHEQTQKNHTRRHAFRSIINLAQRVLESRSSNLLGCFEAMSLLGEFHRHNPMFQQSENCCCREGGAISFIKFFGCSLCFA